MNAQRFQLQQDLEVNLRGVLQSSTPEDFPLTAQRNTHLTKLHSDFSLTL
jgi:hypothetical protein